MKPTLASPSSNSSSSEICAEIQAQLPIYLGLRQGMLTGTQKKEIASHVQTCQQCAAHRKMLNQSVSDSIA